MDIGETLKARRQALGLTQQQLADKLGLTKSYVAAMERGRKSPSLATVSPFIEALGGELLIKWKDERRN
jgi:transcriptional regulator with XRE-family HTH domain